MRKESLFYLQMNGNLRYICMAEKLMLNCLMHKKRKSHDNSEILFERERREIKVRQEEKEKMYFFLLMWTSR